MLTSIIWWILLFGIIFFILWVANKTSAEKKIFGSIIISYGILSGLPPPDVESFWVIPIYSWIKRTPISISMLTANNLIEYSILAAVLGIIIVLIGVIISGYDLNYIKNKIKNIFS